MKWALVVGTVFSITLSWGHNFMGLTDFFIDYIPMYSKFRAVSSILVIAEFTIPLLAMLALKEVMERPALFAEQKKAFYISFGLTGGLSLLFALFPTVFFPSYVSSMEMNALQGAIPADQLAPILVNLEEVRRSLFTADAWRSFFVIVIGCVLLGGYLFRKWNAKVTVGALLLLCIVDMWSVNKRYLYDEQFVAKGTEMKPFLEPSETDKEILKDKTLDYRVLNMATNTFNENNTAYWHKSIGGYHAAKLRRYQEMIEAHIQGEMETLFTKIPEVGADLSKIDVTDTPVLDMLNTRYYIVPLQQGATAPLFNPHALGNAWLVKEVKYVNNANEEIDAIHGMNPRETAIVDKRFAETVKQPAAMPDSLDNIVLKSYAPNALQYEVDTKQGGTVVFSEIYYPGWRSYIDGEEVSHGRANYILRAMNVPAGKHTIEFVFDPQSLHATETIAFIALGIMLLGALGAIVMGLRKAK